MATSLVPKIKNIKADVKFDCDAVREFAELRGIYVHINIMQEENKRVEKWLSDTYGLYSPDVNMMNFGYAESASSSYNWTLQYFIEQQKTKFNAYFNMKVEKNNKIVVSQYRQYYFERIWAWYFGCEFDSDRMSTFKTNSKGTFVATDEEVLKINEFNRKYFSGE